MAAKRRRKPGRTRKLSVGIVGLGWPGSMHLKGYLARKGVRLAAICDRLPERRKAFVEKNGLGSVAEFSDYREMLRRADVEAVSVCLPNFLHAPVALAALRSGRHVLTEKPPTRTVAEARRVVAEARKRKLVYMYIAQRRFAGEMAHARKLISGGKLGEVYHGEAAWRRTSGIPIGAGGWFVDSSRSGGGSMIDIGVHMLDAVWFAMGCPEPVAVQGAIHSRFGHTVPKGVKYDVDDFGAALIGFADGGSALVQSSWALQQRENEHYVRVYGTKAGLGIFPLELYSDTKGGRAVTRLDIEGRRDAFAENVGHFVDVVRGEQRPETTPEHALGLMRMLEGAYRTSAGPS